jgi:hypothetical protein
VMAAGESFFHDLLHLVPTPWNGQLLAILLLNAALIGASLAVLARQAGSGRVALAALVVALLFAALHPLTVNSLWMPYVYFAPTLLLLVSAASVATGQTVDLWLLALSAWLCINGQAEFLLFSPAIVVASLASLVVVRHRRRAAGDTVPRVPARHWIGALVVSAVLAFPIALNTVLHWPGQFGRYLYYARAASGHLTHHSVVFSIGYTLRYWWPGIPGTTADVGGLLIGLVVSALALALAWYCPLPGLRRFLLASLAAVGLLTVLFVYYALKGVDDNDISQAYLGYFYWAAPLLVVIVAVAAVAVRVDLKRAALLGLAAAVAGAAVIAVVVPQHRDNPDDPPAKYYGDPQIPHAVAQLAAIAHGRPIVLNVLNQDWFDTVGLIAYADRVGLRSCVAGAQWTILFRAQSICTSGETRSGVSFWVRGAGPHRHHPRPGWQVAATLPTGWITRQG